MTTSNPPPRLLAIIAVDPSSRVMCQNPGCGHGVYAAVHIVEDRGQIFVLGSTCYAKRYGNANALGAPVYPGRSGGRILTAAERQMLINNTAELVEHFKQEHAAAQAQARARQGALRATAQKARTRPSHIPLAPAIQPQRTPQIPHPWPWQHAKNTSVAALQAPDGQWWVRVMHRDGKQRLVPWPVFERWEEAFPPSLGVADTGSNGYEIQDIVSALQWLRARGYSQPQVSRWPEVHKLMASTAPH